jgi:hypothetical protein
MTTRMYTRTILLALLTVCLCLGLQAGAAQADFELPAFDVTQDGTSFYPDATVDATGAVHFLWGDFSGLRTRTRGADGLLGPVKTVAPTAADAEHAADGAGNVQFVWRGSAGADWIVRTRRLNPDGTLGPTADLSSATRCLRGTATTAASTYPRLDAGRPTARLGRSWTSAQLELTRRQCARAWTERASRTSRTCVAARS